jgi:hypothetical protein
MDLWISLNLINVIPVEAGMTLIAPQFNRIFKRIYGINPMEFRRRCRK